MKINPAENVCAVSNVNFLLERSEFISVDNLLLNKKHFLLVTENEFGKKTRTKFKSEIQAEGYTVAETKGNEISDVSWTAQLVINDHKLSRGSEAQVHFVYLKLLIQNLNFITTNY